MDDEVDEEEVKVWDIRCTGGRGLGTLRRWFRNEGGAMEWITLANPLKWSLI